MNPPYKYTAGELKEKIEKDQIEPNLHTIFSRLGRTGAFWRQPRNDLDCMMKEYGPATFYITLSPREWMWSDLGKYIREVNGWENDKRYIRELIVSDPVSASRYIHNKFHAVLAYILSSADPIGKVDYYYVREYQGRGLPHYHCLFWISNAPIYGQSSDEEVPKFILEHITYQIPYKRIPPELHRRVTAYQRHKHNSYCMRKIKTRTSFKNGGFFFGFSRQMTSHLTLRPVLTAIVNGRKLKNRSRFYDLPRKQEEQFINDYIPALLVILEENNDGQFIDENSYLLTE